MEKIDQEKVALSSWGKKVIPLMQVAVFVMCKGGFIGRSAAERPGDFYLDGRTGRFPYSKAEIMQAVETLATIAKKNGLDPNHLPEMPDFHNMGIF